MGISTFFIYIISSIILNSILSKIELKKKDNIMDYIIISNIYIIILSGIFELYNLTSNNNSIFLIILFQVLGKIFYLTLIKEQTILKNNSYNLKKYFITLISGYLVNIVLINKIDNIFPSMESVKILIWLFIMGYILVYVKNNVDIKVPVNDNISFYKDKEYIVMQYAKYKVKYYNLVISKYKEINSLIYAIMIYENYNRPELIRKIDILKHKVFHESGKFGIMQIKRKNPISDGISIEIARKKLERIYMINNKGKDKSSIKVVIKKYYGKDILEIEEIYNIIKYFVENT